MTIIRKIREVPNRILFWAGVLLLTSGVISVEDVG